ncbi:hypothetical protein HDU93_007505 [Gonapodya sp. JEL0774]|nr:hypothetical protein HDU93_007505 [Gonapodya sp. JEL0774]
MPTVAEVAKHNTAKDAWVIIQGKVYDEDTFASGVAMSLAGDLSDRDAGRFGMGSMDWDFTEDVTKFADEHPGGKAILLRVAGRDVSKEFDAFHNAEKVLHEYAGKLYIGDVGEAAAAGPKSYTKADVAKHNKSGDAWVIINGGVYDVSKFVDEHPGGKAILQRVSGRDASKEFEAFHNAEKVLKEYAKLKIGVVAGAKL